jgi:hypothetical protein
VRIFAGAPGALDNGGAGALWAQACIVAIKPDSTMAVQTLLCIFIICASSLPDFALENQAS